jgi:hypothetical protein
MGIMSVEHTRNNLRSWSTQRSWVPRGRKKMQQGGRRSSLMRRGSSQQRKP